MSVLTEWFEGRTEETNPRPTILPALIWLCIIGCLGWLCHYVAGHA